MTKPRSTTSSAAAPPGTRSTIGIAVLTRDRWPAVDRCLDSIYQQAVASEVPIHLLVNGSSDDTAIRAAASYPEVQVHVSDVNLGCPGGRNRLSELATTDWVVHVDDDGTVPDGFVAAVRAEVDTSPLDRAVIAGHIVDVELDPNPRMASGRSNRFSGGICVMRRSTFLELGGYPTDGLRQGEEGDYAIRLHQAGQHIWRSDGLVLFHPLRHSITKRRELLRTGLRQAVLTGFRYCPAWAVIPWVLWKLASHLVVAIRLRAPRPYLAGVWDSLALLPRTLRGRQPVSMRTMLATTTRFS